MKHVNLYLLCSRLVAATVCFSHQQCVGQDSGDSQVIEFSFEGVGWSQHGDKFDAIDEAKADAHEKFNNAIQTIELSGGTVDDICIQFDGLVWVKYVEPPMTPGWDLSGWWARWDIHGYFLVSGLPNAGDP